MKKLAISINLLELQGALPVTIKGRDCVIIEISKSRAKPHQNGKVYLNLDVIERNAGADQYGNTHFVCEPSTKEERQNQVKLPILGNGKEWGDMAEVKKKAAAPPARRPPPRQDDDFGESPVTPMEDDDIPF